MLSDATQAQAKTVLDLARALGVRIATAESCTGGLVAAALTQHAGSSAVVEGGWVTYANAAKTRMLGVDADLIEQVGAVSESVARAMAQGALARSDAQLTVSVTGIAGPGGATPGKPVGLVHFATAMEGEVRHRVERFGDLGRGAVREAAVRTALAMLAERLEAVQALRTASGAESTGA